MSDTARNRRARIGITPKQRRQRNAKLRIARHSKIIERRKKLKAAFEQIA